MRPLNKVKILWSSKFAYVIGLMATDGNLSIDGHHMEFTSKDLDLVEIFKNYLNLQNKISKKARGGEKEKKYFRIQFGDVAFYKFLLDIGLTPHKSKTIGVLKIPKDYFLDFLRGCIDGDGNIRAFKHPESKNPQLRIRICSASKNFLIWIKRMNEPFKVKGYLKTATRCYILEYAMADSINLLNRIYYKNFPSSLSRKFLFAKKYLRT
ncbi:MAG: hypothetical protein A2402_02690 [Candidatus Staskawiczbacteria bacterium RIFOXYC1_FULL_37_43]|nr:MAG: hypothetical protein A2813_03535 [Candidatus Staskawiczbacteria bacterium RIFCSPHIGHO2_01_FULL_37_17]OGZ71164.1 MAG: hypothetical protein A2891_03875 [Candidatus Staskawiczbacteria bacterium RIFCSPLOWO2_01_FULL_37_19]OGZ76267.1 MAG: hypothetical protein A2205_00640 [Candidatus Staskawiczbacteria bacterium RIFOXYA1_FULL_37_15]OGZ80282.1 MAG: hypothetical protein A2353_03350 [Candidatus Staskawiczbacteria bacterium RIFOXYB1_FULL_38_37]OGZ81426.1 MAG: hypothetical protein A2325_00965 [Cand